MKNKAVVPSVIFTVLTAVTVILRILQSAAMIDPQTGFYKPSYEIFEPIFLVTLFGLIVAYFIIAMLTVNYPPLENHFVKSKSLGTVTLIYAVITVARCVEYFVTAGEMEFIEYILIVDFAMFGAFLIMYSVFLLQGTRPPAELFLIPSIFGAVRFGVTFVSYVDVIKVTDIILTITMLGMSMMFWHMFARINAGIAAKTTVKMLFGFGFPAALLAIACSVPKYYMNWFLPETSIHISEHISYFDCASGIYIFLFLIFTLTSRIVNPYETLDEE